MTKDELKTLTDCLEDTTIKYLTTLEQKKQIEQDRDVLAGKTLNIAICYAKLSDIHTRLLIEYAKLQVQIIELTNLNYRVFSNN